MKKTRLSFVTMGIPSMFLIFSVLCLVILSLLTLGTARSDLNTSILSMEKTTAYYEASGRMTDFCSLLQNCGTEAELLALTESHPEITLDETSGQIHIVIPVSETQNLHAAMELSAEEAGAPALSLLYWQTEISGSWNPDTRQNVYKGANS